MKNAKIKENVLVSLVDVQVSYSSAVGVGRGQKYIALKDISLDVLKGECLGVIGRNGAGKSTLLRLLAGIIKQDSGIVSIASNTTATMLSLQAGFLPNLTGRDNVILSGLLLGISKKKILSLLDTICELFGYPDFFERPINTYSTGMRARLGFAVAYHVDPDIILVDEVLGVGDQEFRTKSTQMMLSKISSDKTAILVSHNLNLIQSICNRVIWLEHGMIKEQGKPAKVVKAYLDGK